MDRSSRASGTRRERRGRGGKRRLVQGYAGFEKAIAIVGYVGRNFPAEILQMPFHRETWKAALQVLSGGRGLPGPSQLRERRGAQREHLKMAGVDVQGFPRPRQ